MKVYDIIALSENSLFEAEDDAFRVVRSGTGRGTTYNIVNTSTGTVVGSERTPGRARAVASELSAGATRTASAAASAVPNAPTSAAGVRMENIELVGDTGKIKGEFVAPNGRKVPFEGMPDEVVKELENILPDGTKRSLSQRLARSSANKARRFGRWVRNMGLHLFGLSAGVYTGWTIFTDWRNNSAALDVLMQQEFVDSARTREVLRRADIALNTAFGVAISTEIVGTIVTGITANKLLRAARVGRSVFLGIPGPGWLMALISTLVMEGAVWAFSWAMNRYGPEWIANEFMKEWSLPVDESEMGPVDVDDPELNRALERDRASRETPVDANAVQNIRDAVRGSSSSSRAPASSGSNPSRSSTPSGNGSSGSRSSSGGLSQSQIDRLRRASGELN